MTLVNLNKARKQKNREDKRAKANENALKHGRSKAERAAEARRAALSTTQLDGHKRTP